MKDLARNKKKFYYALYTGVTELTDGYGNRTGQYVPSYSAITEYRANISPARGSADLEQFGINENYTNVITTSDMSCPFTETTRLWINIPTTDPHNYVVVRRAESINSLSFAIREVSVSPGVITSAD